MNQWQMQIRTLQVIVGAIVVGCVIFTVVAVVVGSMAGKPASPGIISYLAVGLAAVMIVARSVVLGLMASRGRKSIAQNRTGATANPAVSGAPSAGEMSPERARLAGLFMARTIAGAAILEGAALFSLVAYLVENSPISLAAALVLLVFIVLQFPTLSRATAWLDDQERRLREEITG